MKYFCLVFILSILLGCAKKEGKDSDNTASNTSAKIKVYAVNYSVGGE